MPLALAKQLNKKAGTKPAMKKGGKAPAKGSGKR
jgi:hypothetical protein